MYFIVSQHSLVIIDQSHTIALKGTNDDFTNLREIPEIEILDFPKISVISPNFGVPV